jgi:hypothetical protein
VSKHEHHEPIPEWITLEMSQDPEARAGWESATREGREHVAGYITSAHSEWGRHHRLKEIKKVLASGMSIEIWRATGAAALRSGYDPTLNIH